MPLVRCPEVLQHLSCQEQENVQIFSYSGGVVLLASADVKPETATSSCPMTGLAIMAKNIIAAIDSHSLTQTDFFLLGTFQQQNESS